MVKKTEEKLQKLSKIYENSVKGRKAGKRMVKKQTKKTTKTGDETIDEVENEVKNESIQELEESYTECNEKESRKRVERKISLPVLNENRPLSQISIGAKKIKTGRRVSLPIITTGNGIISQSLKLDGNKSDVYQERVTLDGSFEYHNVKLANVHEGGDNNEVNTKERLPMRRRSSVFHASVVTPASRGKDRKKIDPAKIEELIKNFTKAKSSPRKFETAELEEQIKSEVLRHAGKVTGKAAMFSNYLIQNLNLRYLHAVYHDPDYNDKYERFPTPEIETDEEKESDILKDMHEDGRTTGGKTQSEASMSGLEGEGHSSEIDSNDSHTDAAETDELSSVLSDEV